MAYSIKDLPKSERLPYRLTELALLKVVQKRLEIRYTSHKNPLYKTSLDQNLEQQKKIQKKITESKETTSPKLIEDMLLSVAKLDLAQLQSLIMSTREKIAGKMDLLIFAANISDLINLGTKGTMSFEKLEVEQMKLLHRAVKHIIPHIHIVLLGKEKSTFSIITRL